MADAKEGAVPSVGYNLAYEVVYQNPEISEQSLEIDSPVLKKKIHQL